MSAATTIEWTEATWNPVRGCSRVSEGCRNCYAERHAARFAGPGGPFREFAERTDAGPRWTGKVELLENRLLDPLYWRTPRRVFVNSMADLFHEKLEWSEIHRVFAVMALCPWHTFQILTKRAGRLAQYFRREHLQRVIEDHAANIAGRETRFASWPLPNVWLGVSVEDQPTADARIPELLQTPAAVRFVSYEPALSAVDFSKGLWLPTLGIDPLKRAKYPWVDWIIVGGESGPGARPFDLQWGRDTIRACKAASVAVFVKQLGANPYEPEKGTRRLLKLRDKKGGNPGEWPADLQIREFPYDENDVLARGARKR